MNALDKEELRRLTLNYLYERSVLAYEAGAVQRSISRKMRCIVSEVEDALVFLHDAGLVKLAPNKLGGIKYYQISSEGSLAVERGD